MINFIKKMLGYHVCEDFTPWAKKHVKYHRPVNYRDGNLYIAGAQTIEWVETHQERTCKDCGKIFQKKLEF